MNDEPPVIGPKRSQFTVHVGVDFNNPNKWPEGATKYLAERGYKREWLPIHAKQDGILCLEAGDPLISGTYLIVVPEGTSFVLLYVNADLDGNADGYAVGVAFNNIGKPIRKVAPTSESMSSRPFFPLGFKASLKTYRCESPLKALVLRRASGGECNAWATNGADACTDTKHRAGALYADIERLLTMFDSPVLIDVPDSDYGAGVDKTGNSNVIAATRKLMRLAQQASSGLQGYVAHLTPLGLDHNGRPKKTGIDDAIAVLGFETTRLLFLDVAMRWNHKPAEFVPGELRPISALLQESEIDWAVDDLLPAEGVLVIFGGPSVGKTFLAIHLSMCKATGTPWLGKPTTRHSVVYVALEGRLGRRVEAYLQHYNLDSAVPFYAYEEKINLLHADSVDIIVERVRSVENPGLLVIDTMARAIPGAEENSAREMGVMISAVDRIRAEAGVAVCLIAHTGKDEERGIRGSIATEAAVDVAIHVQVADPSARLAGQTIRAYTFKPPRDADFFEATYQANLVQLPELHGKARSSLVISEAAGLIFNRLGRNVGKSGQGSVQAEVMEQLRSCSVEGRPRSDLIRAVVAHAEKLVTGQTDKRWRRNKTTSVKRAIASLIEQGRLIDDGDQIRPL